MKLEDQKTTMKLSIYRTGLMIVFCVYSLCAFGEVSTAKSLLDADAELSATSYLESTGPGGSSYRHQMSIQQAPGMVRFQPLENQQEATVIFRYDKNLIWSVIPENRLYPGVRKYQPIASSEKYVGSFRYG